MYRAPNFVLQIDKDSRVRSAHAQAIEVAVVWPCFEVPGPLVPRSLARTTDFHKASGFPKGDPSLRILEVVTRILDRDEEQN